MGSPEEKEVFAEQIFCWRAKGQTYRKVGAQSHKP